MPRLKTSGIVKQKFRLIAAVKAQKSLYDSKQSYENLKSRDSVWTQVAEQCGIKRGALAKSSWKKIYDSYVNHRKNPHLNPSKTYSMLFKHMKFIDPYLSNITHKEDDKSDNTECKPKSDTELEPIEDSVVINTPTNIHDTTATREFSTIQYWNDTNNDSPVNVTELETNGNLPTKDDSDIETNLESDIESYEDIILPEALNNANNGTIENNSLKMFFDAMFASTTQLSPALQRTVKMKIFSAVLEAEEEAENQKKNNNLAENCIQIRDD